MKDKENKVFEGVTYASSCAGLVERSLLLMSPSNVQSGLVRLQKQNVYEYDLYQYLCCSVFLEKKKHSLLYTYITEYNLNLWVSSMISIEMRYLQVLFLCVPHSKRRINKNKTSKESISKVSLMLKNWNNTCYLVVECVSY